jgi:hypothetical protein
VRGGPGHGLSDGPLWNRERYIASTSLTAAVFQRAVFDTVGLLDEQFESLSGRHCIYQYVVPSMASLESTCLVPYPSMWEAQHWVPEPSYGGAYRPQSWGIGN